MPRWSSFVAALTLAVASSAVLADSFNEGGLPYKGVTISDVRDGKLIATVGGNERTYELKGITSITIDGNKAFNDAEAARSDAKKAANLYLAAYKNTAGKGIKRVIAARSLPIFDAEGRYSDAVNMFLELYAANPSDAVWAMKPSNLPDGTSSFLRDAANTLTAKLNTAPFNKPGDPQKDLRTMLLEIYNKQGDTTKAAEMAKLLGSEIPLVPSTGSTATTIKQPDTGTTTVTNPPAGATLGDIESALAAKQYDRAITAADTALAGNLKDEVAIRVFLAKASALQGQNKLDAAAATYLRIAAHYPTSPAAADALYSAAEIQKKLNHLPEARALANEILTKHKDRPAAVKVRNLGL